MLKWYFCKKNIKMSKFYSLKVKDVRRLTLNSVEIVFENKFPTYFSFKAGQYITIRKDQPLFANARSMKNALDRARMRQANRIFETNNEVVLTKADLVTLSEEDLRQSRVFDLA